jgi:hypothetical protein
MKKLIYYQCKYCGTVYNNNDDNQCSECEISCLEERVRILTDFINDVDFKVVSGSYFGSTMFVMANKDLICYDKDKFEKIVKEINNWEE